MVSDEILSRETSLIYQNAIGFDPVEGNLRNWHGLINDKMGKTVSVTVIIPEGYPSDPPEVHLQEGIVHPNLTNGKFLTRSIARWKSNYHIHQILREVRQVITSSVVQSADSSMLQTNQQVVDNNLNNQITMLKQQLDMKKQEHNDVQSNQYVGGDVDNTLSQITEDTLVDIQNELFALEDAYDRADLNGVDFSKQFLTLQKRYYMIQKTQ